MMDSLAVWLIGRYGARLSVMFTCILLKITQCHYVLPTCLAAEYPPYIRFDGMREQRYAALNEYGDIEFMNSHMVRICSFSYSITSHEIHRQRPSVEEASRLQALILAVRF